MGLGAIGIDVCQEDKLGVTIGVAAFGSDMKDNINPKVRAGIIAIDIGYGIIQLF